VQQVGRDGLAALDEQLQLVPCPIGLTELLVVVATYPVDLHLIALSDVADRCHPFGMERRSRDAVVAVGPVFYRVLVSGHAIADCDLRLGTTARIRAVMMSDVFGYSDV